MKINEAIERNHGHMWWVGAAGAAAGAVLMIYVPSLPAISNALLLFAGFHLVGALVLLGSLYLLGGNRIARRLPFLRKKEAEDFDFGWPLAFTYGPWVAVLVMVAAAVAIQVAAPAWWPLAACLTLLAAGFFAGGLITRASGQYDHAVLPFVDLPSGENSIILDGGSGAGRTTVALGRALKQARFVALDRFDSGYISGGGQSLLERNLRRAGLTERVRIERGDLTALPFPDRAFDGAVSAHAIDHLGTMKEQGLREMLRVLKPGGRFLLIAWVPGWTMFTVANVFALFLSSKADWRRMATRTGFAVADEGTFNGYWFAVLKKPDAA